ncbi:hypothetical protein H0H93_004928 [Arthromyces matolae]|nr:hypothetical protein H0H93_004928 [Arthromyces matolae]
MALRPDTHSEGFEVKKLTGTPRYCRVCDRFKPPRAHHCRTCDRCVLRMDHHCPWINNCVGHYNYAHFLRFLFYVDLACSYHIIMLTRRVFYTLDSRYWDEPSVVEFVLTVLNYVACIPVLLGVGGFSLYHLYCLLGNSTTIEGWEKNKVATLVRRGKIHENLGRKRNLESVLGTNKLLWCWPGPAIGNGLNFEVTNNDDHLEDWPPSDPSAAYYEMQEEHQFVLPSTPWTFENDDINPHLEAFNSQRRTAMKRRKPQRGHGESSLPPYHPDYEERVDEHLESAAESSDEEYDSPRRVVRTGSEGYEVRPVDREELLRRYLQENGHEFGRYKYYIPTHHDDDDDSDSDTPLAQSSKVE